jgi:hypothetical protein
MLPITLPMARQAKNGEKANAPVKLRPSTKKKLADYRDKKNLGIFDDAVLILLDIAEKFAKDITIQTEPSVTIKGKEEKVDGVQTS